MSDKFIQVPLDGPGKKVATSEVVDGGGATVERQQVVIADPSVGGAGTIAPVSSATPAGTEPGLYVRIVSGGGGGGGSTDVTDRAARLLGHTTVDSLPALPAGTNVIGHVIVDSAGNVSVTSLPSIPAGSNVIGHVIVDSVGGTVDVSDRSGRLVGHVTVDTLPSLPSGTNVIGHVIVDSGSVSLSAAIPAGTNVIGHVIVDSVSGTVTVSGTVAVSSVSGTVTTDPIDRSARLLGHVTVDNATIAVTQSGVWNVGVTGTVTVAEHLVDQGLAGSTPWPVTQASQPLPAGAATDGQSVANLNEIARLLQQQVRLLRAIVFSLGQLKEPYINVLDDMSMFDDDKLQS